MIDPSKQSDCLSRSRSMPVIAVFLSSRSATAIGAPVHAANPFSAHRRASALLARSLRAGRAARSGVQPGCVKSCLFHRAQGVIDRHLRGERGLPGILAPSELAVFIG